MKYKIPPEEHVVEAIKSIGKGKINSQRELSELATKKIRKFDPKYKLSEKRARRIAALYGLMAMEIHARTGGEVKSTDKCPVCRSLLQPIKNKTLYGWDIVVGYRCSCCPYWAGERKRIPTRYTFYRKL